jgi:hypothetical protein
MREEPSLDRRDDDAKMTQMKGNKSKIARNINQRKMGPNRPRKGPCRLAWSDQFDPFLCWFGLPFDLGSPWSIYRSFFRCSPHPIIPPTSIHQKLTTTRWGIDIRWVLREDQHQRREGNKRRAPSHRPTGVFKLHHHHLHRRHSSEAPPPLCASILVRWWGNISAHP